MVDRGMARVFVTQPVVESALARLRGMAEVTLNGSTRSIHENESIYVPIEGIHRIANPGKIPLELIEVQVGSYVGEDDIVRLDDVYGRG